MSCPEDQWSCFRKRRCTDPDQISSGARESTEVRRFQSAGLGGGCGGGDGGSSLDALSGETTTEVILEQRSYAREAFPDRGFDSLAAMVLAQK